MKEEKSIYDIIEEDLFKFQFNHFKYIQILEERGINKDSYPNYGGQIYLFKSDLLSCFVNNEIHDLIVNVYKNYKEEYKVLDEKKDEGSLSQDDYTIELVKIIQKLLDNLYVIYFNSVDKEKSKEYTKDNILTLLFPENKYLINGDDSEFYDTLDKIEKGLEEIEEMRKSFEEFREEERKEEELHKEWEEQRKKSEVEEKQWFRHLDYLDSLDSPYCSSCQSSPCMCSDPY